MACSCRQAKQAGIWLTLPLGNVKRLKWFKTPENDGKKEYIFHILVSSPHEL